MNAVCKHCGKPIHYNPYYELWRHNTGNLHCQPINPFNNHTAEPDGTD